MAEEEKKCFALLALNDVSTRLSIDFPQYPSLPQKVIDVCIEEECNCDIKILIEDVSQGYIESIILDVVFNDDDININPNPEDDTEEDKDAKIKQAMCEAIHDTLTTFSPPPRALNLGTT